MERIVIRLPRAVKRRLERAMKKTRDLHFHNRCRIVLLYARGLGCQAIAKVVGCAPATAVRVAHRFLRDGEAGLQDGRKDNGVPKVDLDLLQALAEVIGRCPEDFGYARPTWTRELLSLVLKHETQVAVSIRTLGRMLERLNARWGCPRPVVRCPISPRDKARRIRRIERLLESLPKGELAFFVDEVDIHLNPKPGRDWMLERTQKEMETPGINQKRYVAAALNAQTGEIVWVTSERKNSDMFIALVIRLRALYPRAKRIHLILDNFIIHASNKTQRALAQYGRLFALHFLPPYCPEHNRIERLWKQLHDNVTRNHRCRTIEDLMRKVHRFLMRASPFPGTKVSTAKAARKQRQTATATGARRRSA